MANLTAMKLTLLSWACALGAAISALTGCDAGTNNSSSNQKPASGSTTAAAPAGTATETKKETAPVNTDTNEVAIIKTSQGEMVLEFWRDVAPNTVSNFVTLAKKGFYDGTAFHRIIKGFMVQGGDPLTKDPSKQAMWGTGGPGYQIKAEFNDRSHTRGVISMARSSDPNSAGSQFFICHGNPSFLDHQYTAFGKVIRGDDVLEKLANSPVSSGGGGEASKPTTRVALESIKIVPASSIK